MPSRRLQGVCLRASHFMALILGSIPVVVSPVSAAQVGVTLDARTLAPGWTTFDIVQGSTGTGMIVVPSRLTTMVQEVDLDPATYTLRAPAGGGSGAVTLPFTISAACMLTVAVSQTDTTAPTAPTNLRIQ